MAACVVCWGLALLWQADVTQTQCDMHLWWTVLPGSFAVHLVNMKAYRLSVIIRANFRRVEPFKHSKVMSYALAWTFLTAMVLMLSAVMDPPMKTLAESDSYRPSLNRYQCISGPLTPSLLWLLIVLHGVLSAVCVVSVRNGMEAFRDGLIMKEAFLLLYSCIFVAFVLQQLNLNVAVKYVLRSAFLGFGMTFFCLRLLLSRCMARWLPSAAQEKLRLFYGKYLYRIFAAASPPSNLINRSSMSGGGYNEAPAHIGIELPSSSSSSGHDDENVYRSDAPSDEDLEDLKRVLLDHTRSKVFLSEANKAGLTKAAEFVISMLRYKKGTGDLLHYTHHANEAVIRSKALHDQVKQSAKSLSRSFAIIKITNESAIASSAKSSSEVDSEQIIPTKLKSKVDKLAFEWSDDVSCASVEWLQERLRTDLAHREDLMAPAMRELCLLLHQRLWQIFRVRETEAHAIYDDVRSVDKA